MTATDERIIKAYFDLQAQGRDLDYLEDQVQKYKDELKRGVEVLCKMSDDLTAALYEGGHTRRSSAKEIDGAFYWANYEGSDKLRMWIDTPDDETVTIIPTREAFALAHN